jgi:hypothetical protein
MKSHSILPWPGVVLLVAAGVANGLETQKDVQPSGRAVMEQNADESAQSSTDMYYRETGQNPNASAQTQADTSYGGVADTRFATGGRRLRPCPAGFQCNIFFGH